MQTEQEPKVVYDKSGNKYHEYEEIYIQSHKICPLNGLPVHEPICERSDCGQVKADRYETLYGKIYRCELEKSAIEDARYRESEKIRLSKKRGDSLEAARQIDLDAFFKYCKELKQKLFIGKKSFGPEFVVKPYIEPNNTFIVFWYDHDEVTDFAFPKKILGHLDKHYDRLTSSENIAVSYIPVPDHLVSSIQVYFYLEFNKEIKGSILQDDNPVYIKSKNISRYLEAAYGMSIKKYKEIMPDDLGLTTFHNYDSELMLKQEIDEAIRRSLLLKLQKQPKLPEHNNETT